MFDHLTKSIYINGKWQKVSPKKSAQIYNPATHKVITTVSYGGAEETHEAIEAAHQAFQHWSTKTGRERSEILYKAQTLMRENKDRLAKILTMEQGKPLKESCEPSVPPRIG